jgi:hypothetical protein
MSPLDATRVPSGLIQPLISTPAPVHAPVQAVDDAAQQDEAANIPPAKRKRKTPPRVAVRPTEEETCTLQIVLPVSLAHALHLEAVRRKQTRSAMVAHAVRQQYPALRMVGVAAGEAA